jgi:hypothetical protein
MDNINTLAELRILLENEFTVINKKLTNYDKNLIRILRRLENRSKGISYTELPKGSDIKVTSYMDE